MKIVRIGGRRLIEFQIGDPGRDAFEARIFERALIHDAVRPAQSAEGFFRRVEGLLERLTSIVLVPAA